jgi:general secretion pathway protein M
MDIRRIPYLAQARSRYSALERRDRLALNGLFAFFAVLVVYYGLWSPANNFLEAKREARDYQLSLLQYMRESEREARSLKTTAPPAVSGQALLTQVSRTAQQFSINPNRLQPEGAEGVSVWFDAVAFNDLVRWLESLSQQGVSVRQISIDRQADPGKVNARVVLRS